MTQIAIYDIATETETVREMTADEQAIWDEQTAQADADFTDIRDKRNKLLTACDWTQLNDCQLDADKKTEWATYRQELRDYPSQSDKLSTLPDWPTPPT